MFSETRSRPPYDPLCDPHDSPSPKSGRSRPPTPVLTPIQKNIQHSENRNDIIKGRQNGAYNPTTFELFKNMKQLVKQCLGHICRQNRVIFNPHPIAGRAGIRRRPHRFYLPQKDDKIFIPRVLYRFLFNKGFDLRPTRRTSNLKYYRTVSHVIPEAKAYVKFRVWIGAN